MPQHVLDVGTGSGNYYVGLIAQNELGLTRDNARDFFIMAENMSSAIDAPAVRDGLYQSGPSSIFTLSRPAMSEILDIP